MVTGIVLTAAIAVGMIKNRPKQKCNPENPGFFQKSRKSLGKYGEIRRKNDARLAAPYAGNAAKSLESAPRGPRRGSTLPHPRGVNDVEFRHAKGPPRALLPRSRGPGRQSPGPRRFEVFASHFPRHCPAQRIIMAGIPRHPCQGENLLAPASSCKILVRLVLRQRGHRVRRSNPSFCSGCDGDQDLPDAGTLNSIRPTIIV